MTDFEHAEISRRLALAIGWPESKLYSEGDGSFVSINISDMPPIKIWRDFDYRDELIAWRVAERFNCFPYALRENDGKLTGRWNAWVSLGKDIQADTAALAVAMAVIKAKEIS